MFFKLLVNSTNHVDINRTSTTHLTHHQITMEFPSLLLSLQILIPTLIFLTLILTKKRAPKLPPGPRRIPVLGNMHNMISGEAPHRLLHKLSQKFGPVMHLQLGEVSVAVISSPEAAKQVMKTHDIHFASRSPIIVAEIISYGCTSITFSPYGEYWRQLRKITTLELLSMKRVQSFRWLREKVFVDLARKFAGAGAEVNFSKKFNAATFGLISRAALGDGTKQVESLHPMINELAELSAGFDIADVFPSVKLFQWMSRLKKRVLVIHKDIDRILEEVIHQHRIANNDEHHEDILDVLLKYQQDGLDFSLTKDNVKSVIVDMLAGGSETSGTTVEWAMAELVKNPRILEKAQEEVRRVFDEEGTIEESRIQECKYLKLVVKETLRMHPALPLMLPRKCRETTEVDGFVIPENSRVIVNGWAINRDPNYWKDANTFQPERFLDNLVDFKGNNFEFLPFGSGRRMCPGMSFGLANVEFPLALFLYHFDWKLGGGIKPQDLDMEDGFGLTARRLKQLYLVPTLTRPLPVQ
ncbi:salviol synthase-like [Salvia splendens]|uniref:salviol synthase-like n=1 Tax=Salvia splendens TaxID=180675 RepID=UPI001C26B961|nr:salviol synthase-like [Salvia splendens]